MKKLLILFLIVSVTAVWSQTPEKKDSVQLWKTGGFTSLNFNQVQLSNWAKGGESSISATGLINLFANYIHKDMTWDNSCDFGYGVLKTEDQSMRKNEDKIDLNSKFGYKAIPKFYYAALLNFKSQFDFGYNYPNDSVVISKFFSPAYLVASVGMDWKPSDVFSLYLSPFTGRFIFVGDQKIADAGAFTGMPAKYDAFNNVIEHGATFRPEFGALLNAKFKKDVFKNINFESKVQLFNNYTDKIKENRANINVDWENNILMKINSFVSANIFLHFLYDHYTKIPLYEKINGVKTKVGDGPRLQLKEVLGIGFNYKF